MKKRLAVLLCVLLCALGLSACASSTDNAIDADVESSVISYAESLITQITALDDDSLADAIDQYSDDSDYAGILTGLESWQDNKEELGAYVSTDSTSVRYESTNKIYIATVNATFENRTGVMSVSVEKKSLGISSVSFTPDYTLGEKMEKAALNTVMGLVVVFVMLILISLIIYCFKFIHEWEERAKANNSQSVQTAAPAVTAKAAEAAPAQAEDLTDDLELVAVITAAIAASEQTSPNGLVVRSIKRAGRSNWKKS